ncbi:MAG: sugar phosphate isomerase/epimerase family protein [Thermodesulfobacteriota bacterium]
MAEGRDVIWVCGSAAARGAAQPLIEVLAERASCLTIGPGGGPGPDLDLGERPDLNQALDACPLELRPKACVWLGGSGERPPQGLDALPCPVLGWGGAGPEGSLPAGAEAAAAAVCAAARDGLGLAWLPKVQVNLPLRDLLGRYAVLAEASPAMNFEVGVDHLALDSLDQADLAQARGRLAGRRVTVHLPFGDLVPGSPDPQVRGLALARLGAAADWALLLGAGQAVMHTGYDERLHQPAEAYAERLAEALAPLVSRLAAGGCRLALENTFEPEPALLLATHRRLAARFGDDAVGLCLDVGHVLAFAQAGLPDWWAAFAPHLLEMHLHDNAGGRDQHLPPGVGEVDWAFLRHRLAGLARRPVLTLEPHREGDLWASLRALHRLWGPPLD